MEVIPYSFSTTVRDPQGEQSLALSFIVTWLNFFAYFQIWQKRPALVEYSPEPDFFQILNLKNSGFQPKPELDSSTSLTAQ